MSLGYLLHSNHKVFGTFSKAYREDCGAKSSVTPTSLLSGDYAQPQWKMSTLWLSEEGLNAAAVV